MTGQKPHVPTVTAPECGTFRAVPSLQAEGGMMRQAALGMALLVAGAASPARSEGPPTEPPARLGAEPMMLARAVRREPAQRYNSRLHIHLGHVSPIRTVAGGVDASPFVTALPGEMWHGRLRSFGAADGIGFSGVAVRARSIGFRGLQSEHHVSGFLASELRYGIAIDRDDLLTVDLNAASQRMPAMPTIGHGKSIRVGSFYLGASLVHDRRLFLTGGWYRLSESRLSPFDYAIERTAGMPAAGQGLRLGLDWRLSRAGAASPARISLEWRDGDADRDRLLGLDTANGRERRLLLRFSEAF